MIAALETVDPLALDPGARVDLMVAWERQSCWVIARGQPVMAAVGHAARLAAEPWNDEAEVTELGMRSAHAEIGAEIGAALRLDDHEAATRLDIAATLISDLPAVHQALSAGDISPKHACAIVDSTRPLPPDKARQVADRVLRRARHQTVGQLRRCLRRAVIAADPDGATDRIRKAHADRSLQWWPRDDGMAELRLYASATEVMSVFNAADAIARQLKTAGPARGTAHWQPIDALRADALIHLAAGCDQRPAPAAVNITLDLPTLLGLHDNPAELAGYGPLPAPLARTLAADGRWRRMILEPQTGALIDLGHTSYQPTAELARYVKTRDRTCIFPTVQPHRRTLRHRPHPPLQPPPPPRRPHRPGQPAPPLRQPPHPQTQNPLDPPRQPHHRPHHLDQPTRQEIHRHPHRPPQHHHTNPAALLSYPRELGPCPF